MTLKESAFRVACLKALQDAVADATTAARIEALADITDAADTMGVKSVEVALADGTKVATLTLAGGDAKPAVTDEAEFTRWVQANHPTEVETVVRVRPAYLAAVLKAGGVDTTTGELVPGIDAAPTSKYTTLRYTKDGRDRIALAWRSGQLEAITPYPELGP